MSNMKRLIIDCDPGNGVAGANVDDGLALALALAAPEISLELITTVSGNTPSEVGYAVASDLIARLGMSVEVARGASRALIEPSAPWREHLDHKVDKVGLRHLWNGVSAPQINAATAPLAVHKMGELICNNPGEITLIAIGPLTNVALALQLYPQMAAAVKEIVIMGGVFNVEGYLKDTNFGVDPEAAHAVLTSGANIILVPMDVTTQTMMTHQDLDKLATCNNRLSDFLVETIRPWMDFSMQTRNLPGCWIHDVLTVALLLEPALVSGVEDYVDVSLSGLSRGRTLRYGPENLRLTVNVEPPRGKPVMILQTVDNEALLALIDKNIRQFS
ncbi:Pyrimidine-specific ribonucleoside hydrolase rihA [Cedecea davisae]|uniref:Inosine-uridine preferring nucleoside hydrolase n=2 Tax=Cedecea davisae TaxID=158484 RepID=S3IZ09_9ENTR|nr:Inosine-uridine preferring nucleoside hydrolase [Cedecea davisae DSM 4568]SUX37241.1 Pyrimidine-specific ribonucleoside hydrolase rihA [Cedecea davisae]